MLSPTASFPGLSVYFDGLCPLCSREIEHYRKQQGSENLLFVDITALDFNAEREGLDPLKVHKVMHVKTSSGQLKTGVDAFVTIWEFLPKYFWLSKFSRLKFVRPLLDVGYHIFAFIRPYLPRKQRQDCEASPFCETRNP